LRNERGEKKMANTFEKPYRFTDTEKDRAFFTVPAEELALWLLGKVICHQLPGEKDPIRFRINVVEAYGKDDPFCHAVKYTDKKRKGATTQLEIGGTLYTHGRNCFDIVADEKGIAGGVLIRGAKNINGDPDENYYYEGKGKPKKLSFALNIEPLMNGVDFLNKDEELWIEDDGFDPADKYLTGERINLNIPNGIDESEKEKYEVYIKKPLRFFLKPSEI